MFCFRIPNVNLSWFVYSSINFNSKLATRYPLISKHLLPKMVIDFRYKIFDIWINQFHTSTHTKAYIFKSIHASIITYFIDKLHVIGIIRIRPRCYIYNDREVVYFSGLYRKNYTLFLKARQYKKDSLRHKQTQ